MSTSITLRSGTAMPLVGFGTFLSKPGEVGAAVLSALKAGYRHIDCAAVYGNESEIGDALKTAFADESLNIKRSDLFITSKLRASALAEEEVENQIRNTLSELQLEYLDLYLIHMPADLKKNPDKGEDGPSFIPRRSGFGLQDTWRGMEKVHGLGLARNIGVSNYNAQTLNDLLNYARVPPAVNQIERHAYLQQKKLVDFCKKEGVVVTAYAPLGAPGLRDSPDHGKDAVPLLSNPTVKAIAEEHSKTPAQVLIRFHSATGVVTIPKSTKEHRIKENFDVFDFTLTEANLEALGKLDDPTLRYFDQEWTGYPMFA